MGGDERVKSVMVHEDVDAGEGLAGVDVVAVEKKIAGVEAHGCGSRGGRKLC